MCEPHQKCLFNAQECLTQPDRMQPLPVSLTTSGSGPKVLINGMDITRWVTSVEMGVQWDEYPRMSLELADVEVMR